MHIPQGQSQTQMLGAASGCMVEGRATIFCGHVMSLCEDTDIFCSLVVIVIKHARFSHRYMTKKTDLPFKIS